MTQKDGSIVYRIKETSEISTPQESISPVDLIVFEDEGKEEVFDIIVTEDYVRIDNIEPLALGEEENEWKLNNFKFGPEIVRQDVRFYGKQMEFNYLENNWLEEISLSQRPAYDFTYSVSYKRID